MLLVRESQPGTTPFATGGLTWPWVVVLAGGLGMNPGDQSSQSDQRELLRRVAQRDVGAFSELYDSCSGLLYSIAMNLLRDPAQAEDVLQDVFLQVWNRAGDFDPRL